MHRSRSRRTIATISLFVAVVAVAGAACESAVDDPSGDAGGDVAAAFDVAPIDAARSDGQGDGGVGTDGAIVVGSDAAEDGSLDGGARDAADAASIPADYTVDSVLGDDTNPGTSQLPLLTLGAAYARAADAGGPRRIQLRPGSYAGGLLNVPPGVVVVGDEASRGTANGGTLVTGVNQQVKAGARLSGLKFSTPNTALSFAVTLQGGAVTSSTFEGGAGVLVDGAGTVGALIQNNVFATVHRGVEGCPTGCDALIEQNSFTSSVLVPITLYTGSLAIVRSNTITGSGTVGIQAAVGNTQILLNTFSATSYTGGALALAGPHTVRGNTIQSTSKDAVVANGDVDLGTVADAGGNVLGAGAAVGLRANGNVQAVGNSWAHTPPGCGVDAILANGTSSVVLFPDGGGCF